MTLIRQGDTMIAIETRSAVIPFNGVLAACHVVADDLSESPWEHWDEFEHEAVSLHKLPDEADPREMQGYCRTWDRGERYVIVTPRENKSLFDYYRENGASRQVAAEMVALDRRRTTAQLVKWYEDGWQWFGVEGQFDALGEEYTASVWGIDDEGYARDVVRMEIALELAGQLEEAGYTVTDLPEHHGMTREQKAERFQWRKGLQCWAA